MNSNLQYGHFYEAAIMQSKFGLHVYPVVPFGKPPAIRSLEEWDRQLSPSSIKAYWAKHPDHELGCVVGDSMIVCDADTPEAVAALRQIEEQMGVVPDLVVGTRRGEHHWFDRPASVYAKSDSHCTETYPERIDIKTGRGAMVIIPPSTNKKVRKCTVSQVGELAPVNQEFVDAIFAHNGRPPPCPRQAPPHIACDDLLHGPSPTLIAALIVCLDPDLGYDDWLRTGIVIFNETKGSDEGLRLWDDWSSHGEKYKGVDETSKKWASFDLDHPNPLRLGTLIRMVKEAGHDAQAILAANVPPFSAVDDEGGEQ
jgi:Bifunctional DNA primase/polymerase, N-terminal/Primase C terminal 2 (PriCT-2)